MPVLLPNISIINENSGDGLTIFLDIFLTKYFLERGLKEC